MPWTAVRTLLASIDRRSKSGWRDLCVLHLVAYYGLRPSEVVDLRLDSIDWQAKVLHVRQRKTRSDLKLPLAASTLELLRQYLEHGRPGRDMDLAELILKARCPYGRLERTAVGDIFEKRCREASLPYKSHVYRLRHTFAMRLLTRGVGVKRSEMCSDIAAWKVPAPTCGSTSRCCAMLRFPCPVAGMSIKELAMAKAKPLDCWNPAVRFFLIQPARSRQVVCPRGMGASQRPQVPGWRRRHGPR